MPDCTPLLEFLGIWGFDCYYANSRNGLNLASQLAFLYLPSLPLEAKTYSALVRFWGRLGTEVGAGCFFLPLFPRIPQGQILGSVFVAPHDSGGFFFPSYLW